MLNSRRAIRWRDGEPVLPDRSGALLGYLSRMVVEPGQFVTGHVSSANDEYDVAVVSLDRSSPGAGWRTVDGAVGCALGRHCGRAQPAATGSCVVYPAAPRLPGADETVEVELWLWPTLPRAGHDQTAMSWAAGDGTGGLWVGLDASGALSARVATEAGTIVLRGPLPAEREWLRVVVIVDPEAGRATLGWSAPDRWVGGGGGGAGADLKARPRWETAETAFGAVARSGGRSAAASFDGCFNGKVARPTLRASGAAAPQRWDLADSDAGSHRNAPATAVTGPRWDGHEVDPRLAPEQYDAVHFHEDDLGDAGWPVAFELEVPEGCESGVYGVHLMSGAGSDVIPLIVAPARSATPADVALWLPTFTYLAYANQRRGPGEAEAFAALSLLDEEVVQPSDEVLTARPDLGLSLYDCHRDGSPCRYSSALRPIVNMRPGETYRHTGRPRGFPGDLRFLRWLAGHVDRVDVIADETVHEGGVDALSRHRVVITGSHPEYVTEDMFSATEDYVRRGGRLMYLGGNGFYWVTGVDARRPHLIEVRRGYGGVNPTGDSPPGESHLSTTGELGGLWRHRGRAPQRAVGVGMAGLGWGPSDGYAWTEAAAAPDVAFVSEGLDRSAPLGAGTEDHPWGAPTDEIDRADVRLGTPVDATVLATSFGRYDERTKASTPDHGSPGPRADVVYARADGGGRLFAVGSIGWADAIEACPDVERVTLNVLRRFQATNP